MDVAEHPGSDTRVHAHGSGLAETLTVRAAHGVAVFCATWAAVMSLTRSAGLNLIAHGINVNAIAPGVVDGEHWNGVDAFFARLAGKAPGRKKAEAGAGVPFGGMGMSGDLTGMADLLASDEARSIVARTDNVDGGQWMS